MSNRNDPTESTFSTSRFAVPPIPLPDGLDGEGELIETGPYESVVLLKDDGARDTETISKLRLANVPEPQIADLMK